MIGDRMENAINDQIHVEFASAYWYLAMAAYCESQELLGLVHWLKEQYYKENRHAMTLYEYLLERGGRVRLRALDAPSVQFGSLFELFSDILAFERQVTAMTRGTCAIAWSEQDCASQLFLRWFINEQIEEETVVANILEKLKILLDQKRTLLFSIRKSEDANRGY